MTESKQIEAWICPVHGIIDEGDLIEGQDPELRTAADPDGWTDTYYCGRDSCRAVVTATKLIPDDGRVVRALEHIERAHADLAAAIHKGSLRVRTDLAEHLVQGAKNQTFLAKRALTGEDQSSGERPSAEPSARVEPELIDCPECGESLTMRDTCKRCGAPRPVPDPAPVPKPREEDERWTITRTKTAPYVTAALQLAPDVIRRLYPTVDIVAEVVPAHWRTRAPAHWRTRAEEAQRARDDAQGTLDAAWAAIPKPVENASLSQAIERLVTRAEEAIDKIGDAEELLGRYGAGGSAAGLIAAIHNLASRAEEAEGERDKAAEQLVRTEAARERLHRQRDELREASQQAFDAMQAWEFSSVQNRPALAEQMFAAKDRLMRALSDTPNPVEDCDCTPRLSTPCAVEDCPRLPTVNELKRDYGIDSDQHAETLRDAIREHRHGER